ncbi:ABC transporter substrate-binding protein [Eubacteriales bacterium mix99]|jgi:sn-glycerol 3-phosphate transport system substrate-binding protein
MKKILSILLCMMLMLGMAAGCSNGGEKSSGKGTGGTNGTKTEDKAKSGSGGRKTVEFWHSMAGKNGELVDEMVKNYNSQQDDVEIVATFQGNYWESASKAQSAASVGESPDLLMMGADHVSIFAKEDGVLADLKPYMDKAGLKKEDFVDAFIWDYYMDDGSVIAIPFGRSTPVMYVNNDMLAEKGLKAPTNWDELKSTAEAFAIPDKQYGVGIPGADTWYWFMIVAQAGGQFINDERTGLGCLEDGTMYEGFKYLQDLHNSGAMFFGPVTESGTVVQQMFLEQKFPLFINSIAGLAAVDEGADFNYSVEMVPEGKKRVVPTGGASLVILESSERKDEAWDFMQWLIEDPKGSAYFVSNVGYLPYTKQMVESEPVQALLKKNPNYQKGIDQLQFASDKGHRVPQIGSMLNDILETVDAIMYDNDDVQKQIDILAPKVEEALKED